MVATALYTGDNSSDLEVPSVDEFIELLEILYEGTTWEELEHRWKKEKLLYMKNLPFIRTYSSLLGNNECLINKNYFPDDMTKEDLLSLALSHYKTLHQEWVKNINERLEGSTHCLVDNQEWYL